MTRLFANAPVRTMSRAWPRIVALLGIAAVVGYIYYVAQGGPSSSSQPGVVYVNPNIGAAPPVPAPAP